jgi:hypothetical protein
MTGADGTVVSAASSSPLVRQRACLHSRCGDLRLSAGRGRAVVHGRPVCEKRPNWIRLFSRWLRNVVATSHMVAISPQQAQYRRKGKVLPYHLKWGAFAYFATEANFSVLLWQRRCHGLDGAAQPREPPKPVVSGSGTQLQGWSGERRACDRLGRAEFPVDRTA